MKKDVIISINGLQQADDVESADITLQTEGRFYRRDGKYYISYEESEITGLKGTRTTLKLEEHTVTLMRTGLYPSQLIFEKGRRHTSFYPTDYGMLSVAVNTREIDSKITDDGGFLDVKYDVEIDHAYAGTNHLKVNVRQASARQL